MLGEAVHEALHIIVSDFSIMPKNKIKKSIQNVLEDERIERYAGEHFPCYTNNYLTMIH
jgi:predicted metal-dependent peptidase